ncbi:MAG: ABC transporter permease subunit [Anaerolineales bacterium]
MITVFKHTLSRSRGGIIGWGITMLLLGMLMVAFFDSMAESAAQLQQLFATYPREFMAFFSNSGAFDFTTAEGFLSIEYFSFTPLILGVFAILTGSGMLAADEERGVLDLVAAHPISRSGLFIGRYLSLLVGLISILVLGFAGIVIGTAYSTMDLDPVALIVPFASMFALLVFLSGLGLLLSMVLPARGMAGMVAGIVLVASFFLNGLAHINDSLAMVEPFLPTRYYQYENWLAGLRWDWFMGLITVGLAFVALAWWAFQLRDIRVGGEGSWRLPWRRKSAGQAR